jgi:hypothetical protein
VCRTLGRGISPPRRYKHRINPEKHPCLSVWAGEDSSSLRLRGHCDQHEWLSHSKILSCIMWVFFRLCFFFSVVKAAYRLLFLCLIGSVMKWFDESRDRVRVWNALWEVSPRVPRFWSLTFAAGMLSIYTGRTEARFTVMRAAGWSGSCTLSPSADGVLCNVCQTWGYHRSKYQDYILLLSSYQRFGQTFCRHLQGRIIDNCLPKSTVSRSSGWQTICKRRRGFCSLPGDYRDWSLFRLSSLLSGQFWNSVSS